MADLGLARSSDRPLRPLVLGLGGAVLGGAAAVLAPVVLATVGVLSLGLVLLLRVPRYTLPSLALAVYALVPLHYLPVSPAVGTFSPSLGISLVWVWRLHRDHPPQHGGGDSRFLTAWTAVGGGLVIASLLHGDQLKTGLGWSVAFGVNVLLVAAALRREVPRARELVVTTWTVLSGVLGTYAVFEAFVLHGNPVFDLTARLGGGSVEQVWATYRATTTLGHPLENAAFFALGSALALARAVRAGSWAYVAAVVASFAGLAATASRGAGAASLLGVLWVLLAEARRVPRARVVAVAGALLLATAAVGVAQLSRSGSPEGVSSTEYRASTLTSGVDSVKDHPWLGVGPGASSLVKARQGGSLGSLSYENGWLEAAVSDGLPFLVALAGLFAVGLWAAARRAHVGAGAALAVGVLVMGSSNVLEGGREGLLRFGLLFGLAFVPSTAAAGEDQPAIAA